MGSALTEQGWECPTEVGPTAGVTSQLGASQLAREESTPTVGSALAEQVWECPTEVDSPLVCRFLFAVFAALCPLSD